MNPHFPIVVGFISSIYGILIENCLLSCSAPSLDLSHFELDMANSSALCSLSSRLIVKAHHCLSFGIPTGILVRIFPKYRPLYLSWYLGRERMHIIETWFSARKAKFASLNDLSIEPRVSSQLSPFLITSSERPDNFEDSPRKHKNSHSIPRRQKYGYPKFQSLSGLTYKKVV